MRVVSGQVILFHVFHTNKMYQASLTLWSIPHFLFGVALYSALTYLPKWDKFAVVSIIITLIAATLWEFIEIGGEYGVRNRPKLAYLMVDTQGRGESLSNQVMDVLLALFGHLLLQLATKSRARLHKGIVGGLWLVWFVSFISIFFVMRKRYFDLKKESE